jgi:Rrf2 family protein
MILSKACIYGMRASLYLASRKDDRYVSISKIGDELNISSHFLTKILQQLTQANLLESLKGPRGGVRLKKSGDKIRLIDVVEAIDGLDILTECALGLPGCGDQKPCPVHDDWAEVRTELREMLESNSLGALAGKGESLNLRITDNDQFKWVASS